MSRLMHLILVLALGFVELSPTRRSLDSDGDEEGTAESSLLDPVFTFTKDEATLNEMFREVEELMEDTQSKLQNAVKEMEAEEVSSQSVPILVPEELPPNYHNESITETNIGNKTIKTQQEIHKETDNKTGSTLYSETIITSIKSKDKKSHETDNKTGSTLYSETIITSIKSKDKKSHECIVDEDCKSGNYCHIASTEYKCLPCKATGVCTRDGECCDDQLCVWGQCTASSRGETGTICDSQQDCNPGLCCSVQPSLLFPVCTLLPVKGELCQDPATQLLDLIGWELEPDGVLDRCPCSNGLVCQPQSQALVSVCEEPPLKETRRDDADVPVEDLPFDSFFPQEEFEYEEVKPMPTVFEVETDPLEDEYNMETGFIPDLPLDI